MPGTQQTLINHYKPPRVREPVNNSQLRAESSPLSSALIHVYTLLKIERKRERE